MSDKFLLVYKCRACSERVTVWVDRNPTMHISEHLSRFMSDPHYQFHTHSCKKSDVQIGIVDLVGAREE